VSGRDRAAIPSVSLDVVAGKSVANQLILIRGRTIETVGPDVPIPDGAAVVDLSDMIALPGLVDCHTHLRSAVLEHVSFVMKEGTIYKHEQ